MRLCGHCGSEVRPEQTSYVFVGHSGVFHASCPFGPALGGFDIDALKKALGQGGPEESLGIPSEQELVEALIGSYRGGAWSEFAERLERKFGMVIRKRKDKP